MFKGEGKREVGVEEGGREGLWSLCLWGGGGGAEVQSGELELVREWGCRMLDKGVRRQNPQEQQGSLKSGLEL